MNRIKQLVERAAGRLGYRVIPQWRLDEAGFVPLELAEHLRRLLARLGIGTVLDIGANRGQYHDFLREEAGFTGRILSFEPIPALAAALKERAKGDPLWQVFNLALGAADGRLALNVMQASELSSFLEPTHEHTGDFRGYNAAVATEEVEVRALASLLPELGPEVEPGRTYLKIDTQGFDLEVLKGCGKALRRFPALQTELSVTPIYAGMPRYLDVLQYLEAMGFSPSGFFRVGPPQPYRMIETDCCMINNAFVPG